MGLVINGEFETPELKFRAKKVAPPPGGRVNLPPFALNRKRGTIQHWVVPPPFENRRQALMELGVERYKEAVKEYYAAIGQMGVERAQRTYSKWVVRMVVREFETQVRRFQRYSGFYRGKHGAKYEQENVSQPQGVLIDPLELYKASRLLIDLEYALRRYQVAANLREQTERLIKQKLSYIWGVQ